MVVCPSQNLRPHGKTPFQATPDPSARSHLVTRGLTFGRILQREMQVYKHLRWLWDDPTVQASACRSRNPDTPGTELSDPGSGTWDQTNTILVDNSLDKADSESYNLVQVEEFTGKAGDARDDVLSIVLA